MIQRPLFVCLALQVGIVPALAQRDASVQRWPTRESAPASQGDQSGGARTRDREAQPRSAPPRVEQQRGGPPVNDVQSRRGGTEDNGERARRGDRRAEGRQARGDDNGRVAVPRPRVSPVRPNRPNANVYIVRPPAYRYTPRFNRPYVYGAFGPGYFYYGSFGWYPRSTYFYDRGYFGRGYGYDVGEVRLRVEPRWAEVYVDGFFAGTVDEFDGIFQSLKLESGPYHVEIVAPGYEPLEVDLRVSTGQKITYRAEMRREF